MSYLTGIFYGASCMYKFLSKYRTNISLGGEDLFYKGASPFQYNLESRNISMKEVTNIFYIILISLLWKTLQCWLMLQNPPYRQYCYVELLHDFISKKTNWQSHFFSFFICQNQGLCMLKSGTKIKFSVSSHIHPPPNYSNAPSEGTSDLHFVTSNHHIRQSKRIWVGSGRGLERLGKLREASEK